MNPEQRRPLRRVAIVGGAWTRRLAPYDDPSWEIWAFSSLKVRTPRITGGSRCRPGRPAVTASAGYPQSVFIAASTCSFAGAVLSVYMQEAYAWVPAACAIL